MTNEGKREKQKFLHTNSSTHQTTTTTTTRRFRLNAERGVHFISLFLKTHLFVGCFVALSSSKRIIIVIVIMGKRSTIAYSSEDFIKKRHKKDDNDTKTDDDKSALKTYYCTCCSNPVLITDCNLFSLPRRRKDGSIILDRTKYVCRLRAKRERDNKTTAIRRDNGKSIEKQTRYYCGDVPVCYECNDESVKLYVLDGALRSFEKARKAGTNGKEKGNTTREVVELLPVPPCIRRGKGGKKIIISVRVIDRQEKCSVMDISAEKVSISATKKADAKESLEREVLEFLSETLKCRVAQLSVLVNDEEDDGVAVTKEIACDVGESMSPETVFRALEKSRAAAAS